MSKVREAVEWGFGETLRQFAFLDFSKNLKILLQPVGIYYMTAILLCNAHTICHSPQVPQYFTCSPPTLQEYFNGRPDSEDSEFDAGVANIPPWEEGEEPHTGMEAEAAIYT